MSDTIEMQFDYVDLNEIDPSQSALPEDMYTLKVLKAEMTSGISKTTNKPYQCVTLSLGVTDHPDYSGRRVWERIFPGEFGNRALRRIMDATGVAQIPGTPLTEWLKELSTLQPVFKVKIERYDDIDRKTGEVRSRDYKGEPTKLNRVSWFNVLPA